VRVLAVLSIVAGLFFLAVSAFGLVRFPDFFTRAHVVAKSETLGMILVITGIMFHHGFGSGTWRLLLLILFAMVANPTAIHALARAAQRRDDLPGDPDPARGRHASGGEAAP
jgi:multicomponent Na+:H+ antiporter subunit G